MGQLLAYYGSRWKPDDENLRISVRRWNSGGDSRTANLSSHLGYTKHTDVEPWASSDMIKLKIHQMILVWLFQQILFWHWIFIMAWTNSRVWSSGYNYDSAREYPARRQNHPISQPVRRLYQAQNRDSTAHCRLDQIFAVSRRWVTQKPITIFYFLVVQLVCRLLLSATMFYALNLKGSIRNYHQYNYLEYYFWYFLTPYYYFDYFQVVVGQIPF